MQMIVQQAGERLLAAGISVACILNDGSKATAHPWRPQQRQRLTPAEFAALVRRFVGVDVGLAIVAGRASGNLEILDFDTLELIGPWSEMVEALLPGLLSRLVMVQTPRPGQHVYYRCPVIAGNQKLAQALDADGKPKTLIETRGLGGYTIIPPSPPACHPMNKSYALMQGDLTQIPEITPDERNILLNSARTFNTYVNPARVVSGYTIKAAPSTPVGDRPGDIFADAVSWAELLEHHGWTLAGSRGELLFWRRPGKSKGWSATTGLGQTDLLYVFSTNAQPFEAETCYTRFGAYAVLEHGGDFQKAARLLYFKGYQRPKPFQKRSLVDPWLGPKWKIHSVPTGVPSHG